MPSWSIYRPPPCIIAWFCSWNRVPSLSLDFKNLSTQRVTQASSLTDTDFEVKSFTQSSKHLRAPLASAPPLLRGACRLGAVLLDKVRVHLLLISLPESPHLKGSCRTFMKSFIWRRSATAANSRCSDGERLAAETTSEVWFWLHFF